jgi:hypothetical protein
MIRKRNRKAMPTKGRLPSALLMLRWFNTDRASEFLLWPIFSKMKRSCFMYLSRGRFFYGKMTNFW